MALLKEPLRAWHRGTSYLLEEAQKLVLFPFRRVNSTRAWLNESHLIGVIMAARRPHVPTTSEHACQWLCYQNRMEKTHSQCSLDAELDVNDISNWFSVEERLKSIVVCSIEPGARVTATPGWCHRHVSLRMECKQPGRLSAVRSTWKWNMYHLVGR